MVAIRNPKPARGPKAGERSRDGNLARNKSVEIGVNFYGVLKGAAVRHKVVILLFVLSTGGISRAQTPIDIQPVKKLERGNSLGTCGYTPVEKEKPFYAKLASEERATGSFMAPYEIQG